MTIDEAIEIDSAPYGSIPWQTKKRARSLIVAEYLRLTDPKPLTVELIEKELGERCVSNLWWVNDKPIRWYPHLKQAELKDAIALKTLGHLRQIVAMLRGGGK